MDFMFTEEQKELRRRVRKFAEEKLAPLAPVVDESEEISWDLVKLLADEGLLRLMVPKEYGGARNGKLRQHLHRAGGVQPDM